MPRLRTYWLALVYELLQPMHIKTLHKAAMMTAGEVNEEELTMASSLMLQQKRGGELEAAL